MISGSSSGPAVGLGISGDWVGDGTFVGENSAATTEVVTGDTVCGDTSGRAIMFCSGRGTPTCHGTGCGRNMSVGFISGCASPLIGGCAKAVIVGCVRPLIVGIDNAVNKGIMRQLKIAAMAWQLAPTGQSVEYEGRRGKYF